MTRRIAKKPAKPENACLVNQIEKQVLTKLEEASKAIQLCEEARKEYIEAVSQLHEMADAEDAKALKEQISCLENQIVDLTDKLALAQKNCEETEQVVAVLEKENRQLTADKMLLQREVAQLRHRIIPETGVVIPKAPKPPLGEKLKEPLADKLKDDSWMGFHPGKHSDGQDILPQVLYALFGAPNERGRKG